MGAGVVMVEEVAAVVGHCKARGTAAGVRLPVTLAVACSIIYADLNLMEHMCVAAADILPRLARKGRRTSDRAGSEECEAQTGL